MKKNYKMILPIQRVVLGEVTHEVTVRNINGKYHCRVFTNGELNQEAMCEYRIDIGYTCRHLLRWEDKCGNWSDFASSSRKRLNKCENHSWGDVVQNGSIGCRLCDARKKVNSEFARQLGEANRMEANYQYRDEY